MISRELTVSLVYSRCGWRWGDNGRSSGGFDQRGADEADANPVAGELFQTAVVPGAIAGAYGHNDSLWYISKMG